MRYDEVRNTVARHAKEFVALRGRFSLIGKLNGPPLIKFIDDGLATSPLPTLAALATLQSDVVAIILGGYDRGVDYQALIDELVNRTAPTCILTLGPVGDRIYAALLDASSELVLTKCLNMYEAVQKGYDYLVVVDEPGVVLLSPAAPSFDAYKNWEERSADFEKNVRIILSVA
jgi:UDP-N-acetylmuramoylalanine--D-glutamate ligase